MLRSGLKTTALGAAVATMGIAGWAPGVAAQPLEPIACGEVYSVKRGDILSRIALRVVPTSVSFQDIVSFNPGVIADPNRISIGMRLVIPCLGAAAEAETAGTEAETAEATTGDASAEGAGVVAAVAEAATAPIEAAVGTVAVVAEAAAEAAGEVAATIEGAAAPAPAPEPAPTVVAAAPAATPPAPTPQASARALKLDILTGSSYAPYVDRDLPHRGFSTHVVDTVFGAPESGVTHRVDLIDDWSSHLRILLAEGKYDLAFPWFRPDCTQYDRLGDEGRWRCDNLRFSRPIHEVVVTFYARAGEAAALSDVAALEGKRLCRPAGYYTHDLAARGLMPPYTERLAPRAPADCMTMLINGEADVVTMNAEVSEEALRSLDATGQVQEITDLAGIETLHMVGMRRNPKVRPMLLRFDKGLKTLIESGDWYDLAAIHLR